jgi:hypothetical protein
MTLLEYLQEPPAKFSPSIIQRESGKVAKLRQLGVDTYKANMVPATVRRLTPKRRASSVLPTPCSK